MDTPKFRAIIPSVFVVILLFIYADGAAAGNCHLYYANGTQVTSDWKYGIYVDTPIRDDTSIDSLVTTFLSEKVTDVSSYESKYLAASYDATKKVQVHLKAAINNVPNGRTELTSIYIKFKCHRGNANINVYVPVKSNDKPMLQFSSSVYSYTLPMPYPPGVSLTALYGSIYVTVPDVNNNTDVVFHIDEAGKRYFNISFVSKTGKLRTARLETTSRINVQEDFAFSITATNIGIPQLHTTAQVRVHVDRANSVPVSPMFQLPVYMSTVTDINTAGMFPGDMKLIGTNFTNVTLQLNDPNRAGWDEFFNVSLFNNKVKVSTTRKLPEDLPNQTVAVIEVQAFLTNAEYVGRTILLITWSNYSISTICTTVIPKTCPTVGTTSVKDSLSPSTVETFSSAVSTVPVRSKNLAIFLKLTSPSATDYTTGTTLNYNPKTSMDVVTYENTKLFRKEDPYSESSTYATTEKDDYLHFEQSEYNVTTVAKQIGILYQFSVVTSHTHEVVFGIDTDDVRINETFKIGPASGLLYAVEELTAGEYHFNVTAEVFSTLEHAEAKVIVVVTDKLNITRRTKLCSPLQVHRILEEISNGVMLEPLCTLNSSFNCRFLMTNQIPHGDFFRFNKDKGTLQVARRVDREDDIFATMVPPAAITVTMDVVCLPRNSGEVVDTERSAVYAQNAVELNNPSTITVKVEIEDVNDNPPVFTVNSLIVGYPAQDAYNEVLPSSIVTVKATDKDYGANAFIRYSVMPSEYGDKVTIHPRTGTVYPSADFRYRDSIFTLLAQDRDGKDGCNNATLHVQLKILQRDEISVVYIENSVTEDASSIMDQLKNASNYTFYVLNACVVPSRTALSRDGSAVAGKLSRTSSVLRAIVYAMDSDNKVVSCTQVQKALSGTALVKTVTTLQSVSVNKDAVTMAIAVMVLSTIMLAFLAFFVITVIVVYIRPRRFGVFITPTSDLDSTEKLVETMEPGSLSEPMVTNEMERVAINVKETNTECEQKPGSGSTERTATDSVETNQLEELQPFVPLQRATQSSSNRETHKMSPRPDKKSPRPRKKSQPVRGDLIPDPDKLLSYKKYEGYKKEEEVLEDPTVPGGFKPREPRMPGDEPAERKKSTVTFSTVVETIDA